MDTDQFSCFMNEFYEGHRPKSGPGDGVVPFITQMMCQRELPKERLPQHDESVAIVASKPKTVALCYDRLLPFVEGVPDEISIRVNSRTNWMIKLLVFLAKLHGMTTYRTSDEETFATDIQRLVASEFQLPPEVWQWDGSEDLPEDSLNTLVTSILRKYAEDLWLEYGLLSTPVYSSTVDRDLQFRLGNREIVASILSGLEIIDEESVSWSQVLEFRKDSDARLKYRRFVHWLDSDMVGKPISYIEDAIALRLEDYRSAIRKHGFRTILGVISKTLDPKYLLATSAVATEIGFLTRQPIWALLTQGGLMLGKTCVSLAHVFLDLDDVKKGPNSEIAFVCEAQRRLTKSKKDTKAGSQ